MEAIRRDRLDFTRSLRMASIATPPRLTVT